MSELNKLEYQIASDSALFAKSAYENLSGDFSNFIKMTDMAKKYSAEIDIMKDAEFCLQTDLYDCVPVLRGNSLILN